MIRQGAVRADPALGTIALPTNASLGRRLASLLYEAVIVIALILIAGFVTLPLVPVAPGTGLQIPDAPARALSLAVVFGVCAACFVMCWSGGHRTLPMKTWRITIVTRDGAQVGRRTAFARYVCTWIGPAAAFAGYATLRTTGFGGYALALCALNFAWALIDPDRQFLHDRIAGTRIVDTAAESGAPAPASGQR